jgi:hypothetical protein
MAVLPHIFVVWLCRLSATQRSYIAVGPADRSHAALRAQIKPVSPDDSFDLLACLRKGTGVRRNILRRKIG